MIQYRTFRNDDSPALVDIWNESFTGRGTYNLRSPSPLELWVFSKPYFDPEGLIIAESGGRAVGFVHAGFGPNAEQTALSHETGVTCMIAVHPAFRRHDVGGDLLRRSEAYLRDRGAKELLAGPMRPNNPFYFGLYGGSDSPGFLTSDWAAGPFFEQHGYRGWNTTLVFQRKLDQPLSIVDARFTALRRKYDVQILPRTVIGSWWQECVLGVLEPVEFRLEDRTNGQPAARAMIWEMKGYGSRWNYPAAGIIDIQVKAELRRQGLAKYLLTQLLRYLQDQYFGIAEVQTLERNQAACSLFRSLGFEQVDVGRCYRKGG